MCIKLLKSNRVNLIKRRANICTHNDAIWSTNHFALLLSLSLNSYSLRTHHPRIHTSARPCTRFLPLSPLFFICLHPFPPFFFLLLYPDILYSSCFILSFSFYFIVFLSVWFNRLFIALLVLFILFNLLVLFFVLIDTTSFKIKCWRTKCKEFYCFPWTRFAQIKCVGFNFNEYMYTYMAILADSTYQ